MSNRPGLPSAHGLLLADSLRDDPFYRAIVQHMPEAERGSALALYMDASLTEAETGGAGGVVVRHAHAAAIWCTSALDSAATLLKRETIQSALGAQGLQTYDSIVRVMESATAPHVAPDWWYLSILGVAPQHQRQGHGRAVLAPTLAQADAAHKTCYLETYSDNLDFYQRLGFRATVRLQETTTNSDYWVCVRLPAIKQ